MKERKNIAKEPIKVRFKELADGSKSVYLDIYRDGRRQYEFLKFYITPERTPLDKVQNRNTMQAVNAIKSQRLIELTNSIAGIKNTATRGKMMLLDWMQQYLQQQKASGKRDTHHINRATALLEQYAGRTMRMKDVNRAFCNGFLEYLNQYRVTTKQDKTGKSLKENSRVGYYSAFSAALSEAVRCGLIDSNPFETISAANKPQIQDAQREYLTADEVKAMAATHCIETTKAPFMFSVFSGLRLSDIRKLTWADIKIDGDNWTAQIVMQKTQQPLYLPLSAAARQWMPERGKEPASSAVFKMSTISTVDASIRKWAKRAGIAKHVSFHTARHTFATLVLTAGADLYTVSKLLGHTQIATTQIYAKIVNEKKVEAVNMLDNIL